MEMSLKLINNADREIAGANFPHIRLLVVKHDTALKSKRAVSSGGWRAVTPENVGEFSAVAYLFGRELHQRYRILFFSSRRRHTSFDCDWSSDVCSSDLGLVEGALKEFGQQFVGSTQAAAVA